METIWHTYSKYSEVVTHARPILTNFKRTQLFNVVYCPHLDRGDIVKYKAHPETRKQLVRSVSRLELNWGLEVESDYSQW